jgi:hypothetical protein
MLYNLAWYCRIYVASTLKNMSKLSFHKYLLTLLLLFPFCAAAQMLELTFDADDALYPHFITIDTGSHLHNSWQIGRPGKSVFDSAYTLPNAIMTDTLNTYPPMIRRYLYWG